MLAKLLALLAQSKGGVVAVVLLAGATTATVAATNTDVQTTVETTIQQLTNSTQSTDCDHGQPVVVAQRNAADKLLRDAYQTHAKALQALKQTPDKDKPLLNAALRKYDDELRDELNLGLNKVAALTLGRNGQVTKLEESATVSPTSTATAIPAPASTPTGNTSTTSSCSSKSTDSTTATGAPTTAAPNATPASSPNSVEVKGRVAVAERTTLDANLQQILDDTVKAMDKTVDGAKTALDSVPAPDHGKPNDNPGNKPDNAGKPTASPKH